MELLLVRHARPVRDDPADGAPDPDLGDEGRAQADALAAWLAPERVDALYASPLRRALRTAQPLAAARDLVVGVDPDLRELDMGERSYVPVEELDADRRAAVAQQWRAATAGGDDNPVLREFRARAIGAVDRIAAAHRGQQVAVVCHGGVINAVLTAVLGISELFVVGVGYTSVTRLRVSSSGTRSVVSVNETAHLRAVSHAP